jgi:RNase P subunit RPR2
MKTLKEHNDEVAETLRARHESTNLTGVACDHCGTEMRYSNVGVSLATYPPKVRVECPQCGRVGWKS